MVFTHYDSLLQAGWKMADIDDMDFMGYIDVLIWRARKDYKPAYIDEVPYFQLTTGGEVIV